MKRNINTTHDITAQVSRLLALVGAFTKVNIASYLVFISVISLFWACGKNEVTLFDPQNSYLVFEKSNHFVKEDQTNIYSIRVGASGKVDGTLTVGFEFVSPQDTGLTLAVEGKDFKVLNKTKTLQFANGAGFDSIQIQMIDNTIKDGSRVVDIRLINPQPQVNIGFEGKRGSTNLVILDDESESKFSGIWEVQSKSAYYSTSGGIKVTADTSANYTQAIPAYQMLISVHPTLVNVLQVTNFMDNDFLTANLLIDEVAKTATLLQGKLGEIKDEVPTPVYLYGFDSEGEDTGTDPVVGKIINNNTLQFYRYQNIAMPVDGSQAYNIGWQGVVLKATWIKQ